MTDNEYRLLAVGIVHRVESLLVHVGPRMPWRSLSHGPNASHAARRRSKRRATRQ